MLSSPQIQRGQGYRTFGLAAVLISALLLGACASTGSEAASEDKPAATTSAWKGNPAAATRVTDKSGISAAFSSIVYNAMIGFGSNEINRRTLTCTATVELGPSEPPPLLYPKLEIVELTDWDGVDLLPTTPFKSAPRTELSEPTFALWTFAPALETQPTRRGPRTTGSSSFDARGDPTARLAGLRLIRARLHALFPQEVASVELKLSNTDPIPLGANYTIRLLSVPDQKTTVLEAKIEHADGSTFSDALTAEVSLHRVDIRVVTKTTQMRPLKTTAAFSPDGIILRFERPGYGSAAEFSPDDILELSFVTKHELRTIELEARDIPL